MAMLVPMVIVSGMLSAPSVAKEPAAQFLAKLKERGYFDMVQAYNEQLQAQGIQVEGIGSFESQQAITAAQLAAQERDPNKRQKMMEAAKSQLAGFIAKNASDPAVDEANEWIRKILFEQARVKVARARLNLDEEKKKSMLQDAVGLFAESQKATDAHVELLKKRIQEFRKLPKEKQDAETSETMKTDYLQAKLTSATVMYESAATLEYAPDKRKKRLKAVAAAGGKLTEDYPTFIAGFVGIMLKGRALKELGDHREAIKVLSELAETEEPALRMISAQAVSQIIEANTALGTTDKGIELGEKWLEDAGTSNRNAPAIQELQLALASAYVGKATTATGDEQRKLAAEARKLASTIARAPGPKQKDAQDILSNLPGQAAAATVTVEDLQDYASAKSAGDSATQEAQSALQMVGVMKGRLRKASPDKRGQLEKEIADLQTAAAAESDKSLQYYRQAIRLASTDTDPDEINMMRLVNCVGYYSKQDYFSAAVVGEFLARRFPEGPTARRAASVAMASYYQMFEASEAEGMEDESKSLLAKLVSIANYLSQKWPDQPEAQQALITLVKFMVQQGQLAEAQAYLNKIPVDSPMRGQADLVTGQAIWNKYTDGMKAAEGASTPELEKLKTQAQAVLQGGVDRMKKSGPSAGLANAMLTLARIYIDSGDPQKALKLLLDPKVGPKTLVDQKHASVQAQNFDSVTYKTVLQAQISAVGSAKDKTAAMNAATVTMAEMAKIYGNTPEGKRRLISTFKSMATDMRAQMDLAPANQKAALASGNEAFLLQVQKASNDFNALYWVAESMYGLGESFLGPNKKITPASKKYFQGAANTYNDIMKRSESGKLELPGKYAIQVRMKAASTKAQLGDFQGAIDDFTKILRQNERMLNIQIEAADAFKSAGTSMNDGAMFTKAVKGDVKNPNTGKNTIWGWERIGLLTRQQMEKNEKMKNTFFRSQYNVAECRFLQSKATGDAKYLNSAKSILGRIQASYPDLGGKEWKPQFQKLMKQVGVAPVAAAAK